jgi:hypothetical protein
VKGIERAENAEVCRRFSCAAMTELNERRNLSTSAESRHSLATKHGTTELKSANIKVPFLCQLNQNACQLLTLTHNFKF